MTLMPPSREREVWKAELRFFQTPLMVSPSDPAVYSCCASVKHLSPECENRLRCQFHESFKQIIGVADFCFLQNISSFISPKMSSYKPNSTHFFYNSDHSFNKYQGILGAGLGSVLCAMETKDKSNRLYLINLVSM